MGPDQMGLKAVPDGCRSVGYRMAFTTHNPRRMTSPVTLNSLEGTSSSPEWMVTQTGSANLYYS